MCHERTWGFESVMLFFISFTSVRPRDSAFAPTSSHRAWKAKRLPFSECYAYRLAHFKHGERVKKGSGQKRVSPTGQKRVSPMFHDF